MREVHRKKYGEKEKRISLWVPSPYLAIFFFAFLIFTFHTLQTYRPISNARMVIVFPVSITAILAS